ncbi:hypothetical protein [Niabella drilacis]|uniref:Uncharacterized protein n=1 Tax=Niabella drilacis (strain DSM 25811 / CCM 8410 / CCUG 62505 / LMG 26954 / E90) TaxID=1285928 RepID=A0A1G7BX23_NIADE|nr:hypothetical protein [Niabella drilacis]SDE31559.1 hypothetical protein SAMN04487894_13425 [Niabella drilacis]
MRTKILITGIMLFWAVVGWGQEKIKIEKINPLSQFVFNKYVDVQECDKKGNIINCTPLTQMPINAIFSIVGKKGEKYIIKFLRWELSKQNIENNLSFFYRPARNNKAEIQQNIGKHRFNLSTGKLVSEDKSQSDNKQNTVSANNIVDVTERYFLIEEDTLILNGSVYTSIPKREFVFGTITYLARIRPAVKGFSGNWSTDLNLGIAYGIKQNLNKDWGIAALGGLSFSKIIIDSLSTSPSINTNIEKVALSPTINVLFNYKKFYIGLGVGFDWINSDSEESKRWIYNKKPFYAIGLGINLFSTNNTDSPNVTNK